jgi:plastocyanin
MKQLRWTVGSLVLGVLVFAFVGPMVSAAPPAVVRIRDFVFTPVSATTGSTATAASGVWVNLDPFIHQPHSDVAGCFDTGIINGNGGTGTATINCLGAVTYHCHIHPFMTGTITRTS